jgi:hypothetical protein
VGLVHAAGGPDFGPRRRRGLLRAGHADRLRRAEPGRRRRRHEALTGDLTWLAEASYEYFFPHTYRFTRYQFGGETRLNTAAIYRVYGSGQFRLDVSGELNALHLQRDRERNDAGAMEQLNASGGGILYAGAGVRAYHGPLTLGVGVKRAALKSLNEQADQQGSRASRGFARPSP